MKHSEHTEFNSFISSCVLCQISRNISLCPTETRSTESGHFKWEDETKAWTNKDEAWTMWQGAAAVWWESGVSARSVQRTTRCDDHQTQGLESKSRNTLPSSFLKTWRFDQTAVKPQSAPQIVWRRNIPSSVSQLREEINKWNHLSVESFSSDIGLLKEVTPLLLQACCPVCTWC